MAQQFQDAQVLQDVAYAATVTPDTDNGEFVRIGALTGNITIANPGGISQVGNRMILHFTQDATGGRTVTFGNKYKYAWTPDTSAGLRNVICFVFDGTNWVQLFASVGLPA